MFFFQSGVVSAAKGAADDSKPKHKTKAPDAL